MPQIDYEYTSDRASLVPLDDQKPIKIYVTDKCTEGDTCLLHRLITMHGQRETIYVHLASRRNQNHCSKIEQDEKTCLTS